MAYKVIILYQLYMPSYILGTFTEYPSFKSYHTPLEIGYTFKHKILHLKDLQSAVYSSSRNTPLPNYRTLPLQS